MDLIWNYLEKITEEGEEKIKRKVNRFKTNLRNQGDFEIPQI